MVAEPLVVEFHENERGTVVQRMVAMVEAGRGWINFTPGLDVDIPPPQRPALGSLFTGRGPDVPLATWSPGDGKREPSTIGIEHAKGPRALQLLASDGIEMPTTWRKLQDHPKRGLVCAVPAEAGTESLDGILAWLLQATGMLCPVRRTGEWRAVCYHAI